VATTNAFFMIVNLFTSLVLSPLVPLGVWLGLRLHGRVNQVWFDRAVQACLLLSGV
jgi:uncharacterized protein